MKVRANPTRHVLLAQPKRLLNAANATAAFVWFGEMSSTWLDVQLISDAVIIPIPSSKCTLKTNESRTRRLAHASDDKDEVARALASALRHRGFDVWFDEFDLKVGDSLSESIDEGLSSSRFGIVILGRAFFSPPWPRRELSGLVAQEVLVQAKTPPVWHGITGAEFASWSLPLANIKAASTRGGIEPLADSLIDSVRPRNLNRHKTGGWLRGSHARRMRKGRLVLPRVFLRQFGGHAMVTSITGQSAHVYPLAAWATVEQDSRRRH